MLSSTGEFSLLVSPSPPFITPSIFATSLLCLSTVSFLKILILHLAVNRQKRYPCIKLKKWLFKTSLHCQTPTKPRLAFFPPLKPSWFLFKIKDRVAQVVYWWLTLLLGLLRRGSPVLTGYHCRSWRSSEARLLGGPEPWYEEQWQPGLPQFCIKGQLVKDRAYHPMSSVSGSAAHSSQNPSSRR